MSIDGNDRSKFVVTSVRLPVEELEQVRLMSVESGLSQQYLFRTAIHNFIKNPALPALGGKPEDMQMNEILSGWDE